MLSDLLHGAEVKEAVLVSGDNTVMAFCRHENRGKKNFILIDVDDKRLVCDSSVSRWLPSAAAQHLTKLSSQTAERLEKLSSLSVEGLPAPSPPSSKKTRKKK